MHQDAKNSILILLTVIAITGALVSLCFSTFGSMFFSGVFVITFIFFVAVKIYVLR